MNELKLCIPILVILIVNSIFVQRPQKHNRRNQIIHRHLTKAKSIPFLKHRGPTLLSGTQNIFETPSDHPSPPHLSIHFALWIDGTSLFPGLGQLWLSLGLSLLSVPPCGIIFCQPLPISFFSSLSISLALLKTCLFSMS